jgi:CDP-diacylglycerol--glycerol-3-phosphate 3-phosphatidyltransferase
MGCVTTPDLGPEPDGLPAVTRGGRSVGVPDFDGYLGQWSLLHGGYDPRIGSRLVRGWLRGVYWAARPLAAAGVGPTAVTAAGVALAGASVAPAVAGGHWPLLAVALVVVSGLVDNLDGAVAVLTGRAGPVGYVVDSVADRLADVAYLVALWAVGAPGWLVAAAGVALGLLEYTRARAGNAGFGEIGVVTVGERPTRIVMTAFGLFGAGLVPSSAELSGTIGATATLAVASVGLAQLTLVLRRELGGRSGDE